MPKDMTITNKKAKRPKPFDWEKEYLEMMDNAWDDKYAYGEKECHENLFDKLNQGKQAEVKEDETG